MGADIFIVLIGLVVTIYVAVPKQGRKPDPMGQPARPRAMPKPGLKINQKMANDVWAERYVHYVATSGEPDSLTDEMVRQSIYDIVNNDDLSTTTKYHLLDALQMRVWNDHPRGMAAEVIEEIDNEVNVLLNPGRDWHGRHGDWHSVKGR